MQGDVGIGDSDETGCRGSRVPGLLEALGDWRVYWLALALASLVISLSFNAFFPTPTATFGYSPTVTCYFVRLRGVSLPWWLAVSRWVDLAVGTR
jgi:hypothetical protein